VRTEKDAGADTAHAEEREAAEELAESRTKYATKTRRLEEVRMTNGLAKLSKYFLCVLVPSWLNLVFIKNNGGYR
jgi:hypothetical protein